jgi:hypothetical protein
MAANEALEKISSTISDCLSTQDLIHKEVLDYILLKIKKTLETKNSNILMNTAISLIGIFSNAIVKFKGESILEKYLDELIILFDEDIVRNLGNDAFKEKKNVDYENYKPSNSIKFVLAIQKQYISLLNSYANIIGNLSCINEMFINVIFFCVCFWFYFYLFCFFVNFRFLIFYYLLNFI